MNSPVLTTYGLNRVCAPRSATTHRLAPTRAEAGKASVKFTPTSGRTICGTMRPTKPMGPQMATAEPDAIMVAKSATRETRVTLTPAEAAFSAPSRTSVSGRATDQSITIAMAPIHQKSVRRSA
ncbi:hypothetical protein D3C72_2140020 [compost metagenome]